MFMFGATGRGDDMGVTTGLPPAKNQYITQNTKSDDPCMDELIVHWVRSQIKCTNVAIYNTNIHYIIPIHIFNVPKFNKRFMANV